MKKFFFFALSAGMLFLGCSSHTSPDASAPAAGPRLTVQASPRQGFAPLRVIFHATLSGVQENDPEYYCLKEEWDFGDGAVSAEERNCLPHTPETRITTEFFAEHVYEAKGEYVAKIRLGDGKIGYRSVTVNVIEDRPGS